MRDVTAVFDTGQRYAPGVPRDPRLALHAVANEDEILRVHLVHPDGSPVSLAIAGPDSLTFCARWDSSSDPVVKIAAAAEVALRPGRYVVSVPYGKLRAFAGRRVQWYLVAVKAGVTVRVVEASELYVAA